MKTRIGLDIGIGSVGWAIVSEADETHPARIEDLGVRIFDSGENIKNRQSNCQERRGYRGVRRLNRRRKHRRKLLYNQFANVGMINATFHDDMKACMDEDVYTLKVRGLDEKLTSAELFKCLIHTSNHRGYRDFYEPDEDDEEASVNVAAANAFEKAFHESHCRTVSEYLLAAYSNGAFVSFRNRSGNQVHTLIRRSLMQEEAAAILTAQQTYYPALTKDAIEKTLSVIFNQRDFEDGPGDPEDPYRRYHGFLETLGQCPYYKDERRGFRGTVIADVYAVTNTLSQYRFVCKETGEYYLSKEVARELVDTLLQNGNLGINDVKQILKRHGFILSKSEKSEDQALGKSVKFLKLAKSCLGEKWQEYISEEQFDPQMPSRLHKIGELLSTYQTPSRRRTEMKNAGLDQDVIKAFSEKKVSGTASTSYRYMIDAINAFLDGDIYGNFQAKTIQQHAQDKPVQKSAKLLPSHIDDAEVRSNRVVFKAINETRKIINALIDIYGSPSEIVVEVADELGKSFSARSEETARQRKHEKDNDAIKAEIMALLQIEAEEVKADMIDRYKLFREQGGKCIYSGKPLGDLADVLRNSSKQFEIDHIVPFSLVLDNTLHNKALVFTGENQRKGQRTPLMYMDEAQQQAFRAAVNQMYSRKENRISKKKYAYYCLESIYSAEAQEILSGWKSRNINDTRYITKYICGILNKYLQFEGDETKRHVLAVKGAVTQKFRREWFRTLSWGDAEKNRATYLNHAVDALVAANLTMPYIELGSDAMKLRSIFFAAKKRFTNEYYEYLDRCVSKMKKYYGFREAYTRDLLQYPERIPSFVPNLSNELDLRTQEADEEEFRDNMRKLYGSNASFVMPPRKPLVSFKQERKFSGAICDDNRIKLVEANGQMYKVQKKNIEEIKRETIDDVYTHDPNLIDLLCDILDGKEPGYTIGDYMKENGLSCFKDRGGQTIRNVSVRAKTPVTNFHPIDDGKTYLSGLKYYCIEVYRSNAGKTAVRGIRFVDIVRKNGKLYLKRETLPADYAEHIMYLHKNDYIRVLDGKKGLKYEGFYQAVYNINQAKFCIHLGNQSESMVKSIAAKDTVEKYEVTLLGRIGGKIRCSEPLPFIGEKE